RRRRAHLLAVVSFYKTTCTFCGAEWYEGMQGRTWLGPSGPHLCLGFILSVWVMYADGQYWTAWELCQRWPGFLCSFTLPGHEAQANRKEYKNAVELQKPTWEPWRA